MSIVAGFLLASAHIALPEEITGQAQVMNGGMIQIRGIVVQLKGVAAPHMLQYCRDAENKLYRCGGAAASFLIDQVRGGEVICKLFDWLADSFSGRCRVGSVDLGKALVSRGLAVASSESQEYAAEQETAKAQKLGLWQGEFIHPEKFVLNVGSIKTDIK